MWRSRIRYIYFKKLDGNKYTMYRDSDVYKRYLHITTKPIMCLVSYLKCSGVPLPLKWKIASNTSINFWNRTGSSQEHSVFLIHLSNLILQFPPRESSTCLTIYKSDRVHCQIFVKDIRIKLIWSRKSEIITTL